MYGWGMVATPACPQCGNKPFKEKCDKCGYKEIASKELSEMMLIFCGECGATYGCLEVAPTCPSHGVADFVVAVKANRTK